MVNDFAQLGRAGRRRGARLRYVLLSHDNDGVTSSVSTCCGPPGLARARPARPSRSPRQPPGHPAGHALAADHHFFQSLIDMKNAQVPGPYRAWAHDYRADLPRFLSEVYRLPVTPEQLARVEEALVQREQVREQLFSVVPGAVG